MRKLRDWTHEEEMYLLTNYQTVTRADMAKHIGVSIPCLVSKLQRMGLVLTKKAYDNRRKWTREELEYITERFPHESAGDIGDHLGVSDTSVRHKALEMGLKKAPDYDRNRYNKRYVRNYRYNINGKVA